MNDDTNTPKPHAVFEDHELLPFILSEHVIMNRDSDKLSLEADKQPNVGDEREIAIIGDTSLSPQSPHSSNDFKKL